MNMKDCGKHSLFYFLLVFDILDNLPKQKEHSFALVNVILWLQYLGKVHWTKYIEKDTVCGQSSLKIQEENAQNWPLLSFP